MASQATLSEHELSSSIATKQFAFKHGGLCEIPQQVVDKIPYLATCTTTRVPTKKSEHGHIFLPDEATPGMIQPLSQFISEGKERALLRSLPCSENIFQFITLCDFLGCYTDDNYNNLESVLDGLKNTCGRGTQKIARRTYEKTPSERHIGRDNAVKFLFGIAKDMYLIEDHKVRQKILQKMVFIQSHPRTFDKRIRHHANVVYEQKLQKYAGVKQQAEIKKWREKWTWDKTKSESETEESSYSESSYSDFSD